MYGTGSIGGAPRNGTGKVFVGYVYGMPNDINYSMYTHLCHAFVDADKDGTLLPGEGVPNRELTSEAHKHGVRVILSLGGWGWDANFAAMTLDRTAEDRYVQAIMTIVDEFDYDGIDLDWEYPDTPIEVVGFEWLTRRWDGSMNLAGKRVGTCWSPWQRRPIPRHCSGLAVISARDEGLDQRHDLRLHRVLGELCRARIAAVCLFQTARGDCPLHRTDDQVFAR